MWHFLVVVFREWRSDIIYPLLRGWRILTTIEEKMIRDEYLRVENLYWDQKIKDTVLKYFAFPIPDESENNEKACKKRETALQA